jgi:hypothetical protein
LIYTQFIIFLAPLALTTIVQGLGIQVLNGGMARMPAATATLASYGLAVGITNFLLSPLLQVRQLGLVLVDSRDALHTVRRVVLVCGGTLSILLAALAFTPFGVWVVEDLHGLDPALSGVALTALGWLAPTPVLRGLLLFYQGALVRLRHTGVVSAATMAGIGTSIASVFLFLPAPFVRATPIALPLLVSYAGLAVELSVILWGYARHVRGALPAHGRVLATRYVIRFFWPLALIMAVQGFSRPLVNLFVSRGTDGAQALAVLTVVYGLGNLPYGWLNDIRSLPAAFEQENDSLRYILRFALACGLGVFCLMIVLYWTPVRGYILGTLVGVEDDLAALAAAPLMVFTFFPLAVMNRAYLHGVGLVEHRTHALAPSGPARIAAIGVALLVFTLTDVAGATRGVAALLCGFIVETIIVWVGVRGPWRRRVAQKGQ